MERAVSPEHLWIIRQMVYGEFLRHLDQVCGGLGIRYMPIKGAFLIAAGLAGSIKRRRMLDVDILVRPSDFDRVAGRFAASPGVRERPGVWSFEREFYCEFAGRTVELEIHRALNYDERFRLPAEELFARGAVSAGPRVLPSAEDALLIAVAHALVHVAEGVDTARFEEYRLLASQPTFDWNTFWRRTRDAGIPAFVQLLLGWAWRATGGALPDRPRSVRARVAGAYLSPDACNAMPRSLRRALLEAAFVRRPLGLAMRGLGQFLRSGRN